MAILILSNKREIAPTNVADWLSNQGAKFYIIDFQDFIQNFHIDRKLENGNDEFLLKRIQTQEVITITSKYRLKCFSPSNSLFMRIMGRNLVIKVF